MTSKKTDTIFIIMAGGKMKRWKGFMGVPKYLIPIDNEPLVPRIVKQLIDREVPASNIYITTDNKELKKIFPRLCVYATNENQMELDRFINGRDLWIDGMSVCYLYGDTFYSDQAMNTIIKDPGDPVTCFGRSVPFSMHGKKWGGGEIFGFKFTDHQRFDQAISVVKSLFRRGAIKRCQGWEVYKAIDDGDFSDHSAVQKTGDHWVEIHDMTNDFDDKKDFQRWIKIWDKFYSKKTKQ